MTKLEQLKKRLSGIMDLKGAAALLGWDQQTYMPPGGGAARAEQLATLERIAHECFVAAETGELLEGAQREVVHADYDSDNASLVRVAARDYEKARRIPAELVSELARTTSQALEIWTRARAESNYAAFRPILQRVFELNRDLAQCLGYRDQLYDALLDQYEPGMTTKTIASLFEEIKQSLVDLVQLISCGTTGKEDNLQGQEFDLERQWEFSLGMGKMIGFDFQNGRIDKSVHPFTTSFSTRDVRITTRLDRHQLPMALFGTLHECGHALYEQGVHPSLERTPLNGGASLGIHESQSRLWENLVGRSLPFWIYFFPRLRDIFPVELKEVGVNDFYRSINRVVPSLIRVEADEVTYNLHILLRFELEQELLEERLSFDDLPAAWNQKTRTLLGITPANDAEGVLQDVHWASGLIGYFPTYTLGNLIAAQLYAKAENDIPGLGACIEKGDFQPLLRWLRHQIHRHGRKYEPVELVKKAVGEGIKTKPLLDYLHQKYGNAR